MFYSLDGQSNWTELGMQRIGGQGYDSTYGQRFTLPGSGMVYYYVQADNGSNYSTQAPFNSGNTWPPGANMVARVAFDSVGDANNPEGAVARPDRGLCRQVRRPVLCHSDQQ